MSADMGGEPPCWAHLFDDDSAGTASVDGGRTVDLGAIDTRGHSGVVWSLPHGGDLDVNLVHLQPDDSIGAHVNDEVDVVMSVIAGRGRVSIDGTSHELRPEVLVAVPKGSRREIVAGADGITYLSIHRRRRPLGIR